MSKTRLFAAAKACAAIVILAATGCDDLGAPMTSPTSGAPATSPSARGNTAAAPVITAQHAAAIALHRLTETEEGVRLAHPLFDTEFSPRDVRFAPRRGPAWTYSLTEVRVGSQGLAGIAYGNVIARQTSPGVIEYARGAITERYVVKASSVEQQFVIARRPPARGALSFTGAVRSDGVFRELGPRTGTGSEAEGGGWAWADRSGAVTLGDVTVLDATGASLQATMQVTASSIRIEIDGDALQSAVYPVLVDPEIGANDFRISDMGPNGSTLYMAWFPAVAYNSTNNEYLVVWAGDDNTNPLVDGEFEIFGQRISAATGAALGANDFRISDMGPDGSTLYTAFAPAVAYNSTNNEYLVVWSGDDNSGSLVDEENEIFGQRINAASGAEVGANDFRISDMGPDGNAAFDAGFVSVAYNSANNEFLVVWSGDDNTGMLVDNEGEVYGQRIDGATGAEVGTNDFRISSMGVDGQTFIRPAVTDVAYNGTDNQYLVMWSEEGTLPASRGVYGQRLNAQTGAETGANDFAISDLNNAALFPAVTYNSVDNEYLAVWTAATILIPDREVFVQRIDGATGAQVGGNDVRISDMGPDGNTIYGPQNIGDVTYNSATNEYLVVWNARDDSGMPVTETVQVYGQRLSGASGAEIGANDFRLSAAVGGAGNPAAAYNPTNHQYLIVWDGDQVVSEREIYGQRLTGNLGEYVLDGFGGLHAGAGSPTLTGPTPFFGFDITRDVEFVTVGYYVLDGYGGVHAGNAADVMSPATPYFGFDVAVDLEVATTGIYVLDAFGGVHAGGGAPPVSPGTPYFGFDAASDLELVATGIYVLDAFGGVHAGGAAPVMNPATTYFGFDVARDMELNGANGYFVLDGFGGVHAGGGATPMNPATPYFGFDAAVDLELASTGYYVLDAFGGVHAGGGAPPMVSPTPYFGFNVARGLELQ